MFCRKCGQPLREGAAFCPKCGTPASTAQSQTPPEAGGDEEFNALVSRADQLMTEAPAAQPPVDAPDAAVAAATVPVAPAQKTPECEPEPPALASVSPAPLTPPVPPQPTPPVSEPVPPKRSGRTGLIAAVVILALLLVAAAGLLTWKLFFSPDNGTVLSGQEKDDVSADDKGRDDNLEDSSAAETAALDEAEAAIARGDYDAALDALETLDDPSDAARYEALLAAANLQPEIAGVSADAFPLVLITIRHGGELTADQITLTDNGTRYALTPVSEQTTDDSAVFSWQAEDNGGSESGRPITLSINAGGFSVPFETSYTPVYQQPVMRFMSADVTGFPTVRAYFRIEDAETGEPMDALPPEYFSILENVEGGEFVSREVHAAQQLEDTEGLSITLIADKSSSILSADMGKIKNVMTEFVDTLQYGVGDQAEVLSFDTIVRQMCTYTGEADLLKNGVQNMFPEGRTALYDALAVGITHAAQQKGAGCVIAFTDGIDNESGSSSADVIDYAISYGVPVYIIGVGSDVEAADLCQIAEQTGGQYWFIDDLYDLSEIYAAIYHQEKGMYAIEYEADPNSDRRASRTLNVAYAGDGIRASCAGSFQPTEVTDPDVYVHSSRYELFIEDVSWEEANARCEERGGHLVTITSQAEMDQIIEMAVVNDVSYLWLGGYTSYDAQGNVFGHWITGEDFSYQNWSDGEPSRTDRDGTEEYYIMLWNVESLGGWTWNDQRNDLISAGFYSGQIAYICEWE